MAGNIPEKRRLHVVFTSAIDTSQALVVALGAGLGVWGVVNLLGAMDRTTQAPMLMCGKVTH